MLASITCLLNFSRSAFLADCISVHAVIAHTRWATHGDPATRNSHPQSSSAGNDLLVVLQQSLLEQGFTFESDTDTEVIPKLEKFVFDKEIEGGDQTVMFSEVVLEVMRNLEGAYGIIFKSRRGCPLLLGVKNNGTSYNNMEFISKTSHPKDFFLSSDSHALVEHTKNVLMIEENEVVDIKDGGVTILKFQQGKQKDGKPLSSPASMQRALSILEMEVEQICRVNMNIICRKKFTSNQNP
ncbi:putative glutamine amidotransferase type 2 domain, nucleophile aminohydrolase [Helianthus annuus]|nr:putative glutamine amidotransferase type 2 domain, nucleophile aminohydrolase [Helianthus annuus]KAJ0649092.1 putative glutamine amidotransferase type 2 domain, nucleophile aminohydrolase [Helianthus annuus]KAJ0652881.1 putative glutamine amidotransferase type 2 domain, nucleophile aminohydrolase [Helianthus annuus]KAJ0845221.1 putative glutamine amidotransferase type 2 domain, nucleophile aminohydrolase [Helianthus annuus]